MRFVLIGHPVGHSVSPAIHHAAYAACGLPHSYAAVDCPDEAAVRAVVERIRAGDVAGANVTVPWKRVALAEADDVDESAAATGAANVLVMRDCRVIAYNTDAQGLAQELTRAGQTGLRAVCVIGAGGAARAAVVAAHMSGARSVTVTARRWRADAVEAEWPAAADFRALGAALVPWPATDARSWRAACSTADAVVQATTAGMRGGPPGDDVAALVAWKETPPHCFAYDVVYNPADTPFLQAAGSAGRATHGGLGMLVGQAAEAFTLWLGRAAPVAEMTAAAQTALFGSEKGRAATASS